MKLVQLQAILLAILLVTPLVFTSIAYHSLDMGSYDLCENAPEERQSEERNSEGKEGTPDVEEFTFHEKPDLNMFVVNGDNHLDHDKMFAGLCGEVITPPPEVF